MEELTAVIFWKAECRQEFSKHSKSKEANSCASSGKLEKAHYLNLKIPQKIW